ncbi:hypothetical protein ACNS7O_03610 [Haloferacaceae archaeon DSL9]
MAYQPERPRLYVCEQCRLVYAGHRNDKQEQHTPPARCVVCEQDDFMELERYSME